MKKVLAVGLLAFCVLAITQQEASAWINTRFSAGLNWEYQSGGNSAAWGLWRNRQPGEPAHSHSRHSAPAPGHNPHFAPPGYHPSTPPVNYPSATPSYVPPAPQSSLFDAPPAFPTYGVPMQRTTSGQFATYPRPAYYYYAR